MSELIVNIIVVLLMILAFCAGSCIFLLVEYRRLSAGLEALKEELSRRRASAENRLGAFYSEAKKDSEAPAGGASCPAEAQGEAGLARAQTPAPDLQPPPAPQFIPDVQAPPPPFKPAFPGKDEAEDKAALEAIKSECSKPSGNFPLPKFEGGQDSQGGAEKPAGGGGLSLENSIGSKLFVWLGGLAIAFAGFFLIKYSIEKGLFTPQMRVLAGAIFALATCIAAVFSKRILKNLKIASILMGAGLSIAYADAFAAAAIYKLISPIAAIPAMAAISVLMLLLSKSYDKSLGVLAVIGIFLAPLIVTTNRPNSPLTLAYLAISTIFFMREFKRQKLVLAPILCAIFNILWAFVWALELFGRQGQIWEFAVYAAILCFVFFRYSDFALGENLALLDIRGKSEVLSAKSVAQLLKQFFACGLFLVFYLCALIDGFSVVNINYLPIFAFTLVCVCVNSGKLGLWPLKIFTELLFVWLTCNIFLGAELSKALPLILLSYAELFYFAKTDKKISASIGFLILCMAGFRALFEYNLFVLFLACLVPLAFFALSKLKDLKAIPFALVPALFLALIAGDLDLPYLAVLFSILFIALLRLNYSRHFAVASCALALAGLAIFLDGEPSLLPLFFGSKRTFDLPQISGSLSGCLALLAAVIFARVLIGRFFSAKTIFKAAYSFATLTVGAFCAGYLAIKIFGAFAKPYTAFCIFALSVFAILAAACAIFKRRDELAYKFSLIFAAAWALKLCIYPALRLNPFSTEFFVSGLPILNDFFLIWLLPAIAAGKLAASIPESKAEQAFDFRAIGLAILVVLGFFAPGLLPISLAAIFLILAKVDGALLFKCLKGALFCLCIALGFVYLNSQIKFCFEGHLVNLPTSRAEINAYSIAWILYSIALLVAGFKFRLKALRAASFVVMLLAVGKVFLFDASKLDGLARVMSFALLGICLIGISYLYMRFALKDEKSPEK